MRDETLREELQKGLQSMQPATPDFDTVWSAAELRLQRSSQRRRAAAGVAAAVALFAVGFGFWRLNTGTCFENWIVELSPLGSAGILPVPETPAMALVPP